MNPNEKENLTEKISNIFKEWIKKFLNNFFENEECTYNSYIAFVSIFFGVLFLLIHCFYLKRCGNGDQKIISGIIYSFLYPFISGILTILLWDCFKILLNNYIRYYEELFKKNDKAFEHLIIISPLIYIFALNSMSFSGWSLISFIIGSIFISEISNLFKECIEFHNNNIKP